MSGAPAPSGSWWRPAPGERAVIIGQTGSGKTTFARYLLERLETVPIVIYDTKEEPKFDALPASIIARDIRQVIKCIDMPDIDHVVFRPDVSLLNRPDELDKLLLFHYEHMRGVNAYIDELYTFHKSGQCGPGLVALYTRGRSRGITTIASTQRPRWVSGFALSEAQQFFVFHLNKKDDRRTVSDASGMPDYENPPKHHFLVYRPDENIVRLVKPVLVDPERGEEYTDTPTTAADETAEEQKPTTDIGHVWL